MNEVMTKQHKDLNAVLRAQHSRVRHKLGSYVEDGVASAWRCGNSRLTHHLTGLPRLPCWNPGLTTRFTCSVWVVRMTDLPPHPPNRTTPHPTPQYPTKTNTQL